ncbi:MAG: ABC transporter permease [Neomegalonema sp.]|nr:ABC transporter permease [Neomegalonema sp.]
MFTDPLARRRWANFKANRRAYWSLWIFLALYLISIFAEIVANDKPLLASYRGEILTPAFAFYPETKFNGDFETEADYTDPVVKCLIISGGQDACFDDPEAQIADEAARSGWMVWPLIPWSYDTINKDAPKHPGPPSLDNWLGTDDRGRDLVALTLYGFRLSVTFGLLVTVVSSLIGVLAGAAQGYFGGWVDLFFQRIVEIWSATPFLYVIMIVTSVIAPSFWVLAGVLCFFSWASLVGVVRAEFLRARNFEYVQAAKALGVDDWTIMRRHVLPNAMVATLTMLPFVLTSAISTLAILDFLGFGLADSYPSLGEIGLQGKNNLQAPWLGLTAFFTLAIMLSLLIFIFEGARDAFDPRKTFNVDLDEDTAQEGKA